MEDVLDIYHREYDSQNPWVCFDESCKQLVKEVKKKIEAEPGKKERYDYQYKRNGVANLFMFFEPLQGWRHVEVTQQRTAIDYARSYEVFGSSTVAMIHPTFRTSLCKMIKVLKPSNLFWTKYK